MSLIFVIKRLGGSKRHGEEARGGFVFLLLGGGGSGDCGEAKSGGFLNALADIYYVNWVKSTGKLCRFVSW